MFAGKMKLTTFLSVLAVGSAFGAAGFASAVYFMTPPAVTIALEPIEPSRAPEPAPRGEPAIGAAATSAPLAHANARESDVVVFSYVGQDLGSDKRKDVSTGKPFKVNVYQDPGKPTANRAKVDLDRDGKWDEKLTMEDGEITRKVAPNDDEVYTSSARWDGQAWIEGG